MDFDEKTLLFEAQEAVREISFAVEHVSLSSKLPQTEDCVFLNLETKENMCYCVELTSKGFRIVSNEYDASNSDQCQDEDQYYETIYSLLDTVSPQYRQLFGNALMSKLAALQNNDKDPG